MDFSGREPMEILLIDVAKRWRSWEGCCRKQTNSKPYLLLTPGSISSLFCCWPMTLSNKLKMIVVVVHLFFDQLFNAQPVDGAVSNQYQVIFECVSGQSSYFSCNVALLFWRQDLWGILRNLHPVTKSWKRSQKKKHLIIISTLTSGIVVRNAFKTGSRGMRTIHTGKRVWYTTERLTKGYSHNINTMK